jgi:UDP-2,4-diacetamido-2,4,6-trideoxy-beta-L-altropyranose hydrolase
MTQRPLFVIRADASSDIGGGHVMRCLTLAEGLRSRGVECCFVCNSDAALAAPALARSGFQVIETQRNSAAIPEELLGRAIDAVIFDHYGIDAEGERLWRGQARLVAVIDDIANRQHDCDVLIDPSHGRTPADFAAIVPAAARVLCGGGYTPIRAEFLLVQPYSKERRESPKLGRILVSTGLTDVRSLSLHIVESVRSVLPDIELDVVLGPRAPSLAPLQAMAQTDQALHLHVDPPFMSPLMAEADLAIGAIGTTTWERCAVALPSIAIVLADNQLANSETVSRSGAGIALNWIGGDDFAALARELKALAARPDRLTTMAEAAAKLNDGNGCGRLVDALLGPARPSSEAPILRAGNAQDVLRIWAWRNERTARAMSIDTKPIAWAGHLGWFGKAINAPERHRFFIGEQSGTAIGMVRFDKLDEVKWRTSILLAPEARGRGLGGKLLALACAQIEETTVADAILRAEVSDDNPASRKIFESCGFAPSGEKDGNMNVFVRDKKRQAA